MLDFYGIYLLGIVIISISALISDFYLHKVQRRKEIIINIVALAFILISMFILQLQEQEIYKEYFLAGQRLNCNGFALSKDLGYVLEGEYFLQTSTNKLVGINTCTPIGDVFIYTQPLALGLLVLYGLFILLRYLQNKRRYKNAQQKEEQL
ncbi:MAG TPA: hypothetical protein CFH82_07500 [Sulfurospirillum sp. UBA12182]|jgi:apolipoprotein N-acyltransferase|nr:MAG TPA: hypothetical protein CFH82_07500 [Sulfurospirillum sp. UBA12182]